MCTCEYTIQYYISCTRAHVHTLHSTIPPGTRVRVDTLWSTIPHGTRARVHTLYFTIPHGTRAGVRMQLASHKTYGPGWASLVVRRTTSHADALLCATSHSGSLSVSVDHKYHLCTEIVSSSVGIPSMRCHVYFSHRNTIKISLGLEVIVNCEAHVK